MKYHRTKRFMKAFAILPTPIKHKTAKAFKLFQQNQQHSSLGIKKVKGKEGVWEGRIDDFYRFTFEYQKDTTSDEPICLFRNIGPHDIVKTNP